MKSICSLAAALAFLLAAGAHGQEAAPPGSDAPPAGEPTAETLSRTAYALLTRADEARDMERFSLAVELYRRALEAYVKLTESYPDWEPSMVRFRLTYSDNQLKALLEKIRAGKIRLRPPATGAPAPSGPGDPATATADLLARAKALLFEDKPGEARDALVVALRREPDNKTVRLLLGIAQCRAGRFDDAVFLMENLVEEESENADARVVLGTAYFGLGRGPAAIACMRKALELTPNHGEAHFNLAKMLATAVPPETNTARNHYLKALSFGIKPDPGLNVLLNPPATEPQ
jgi:tetratricopeptide (TPR) repeat protein